MLRERDMNALHLSLVYVGNGARAAATALVEGTAGSHLERDDLGGLTWSHACLSPAELGWLDGMQIFIHIEAYEGESAALRVRLNHSDAVCVFGAAGQVSELRARADSVGRTDLSVTLLDDASARDAFGTLKRVLISTIQAYRAGTLHDYTPAPGDQFLSRPPSTIAKIDPGDPELIEARRQAQTTLPRFIAKLQRPEASSGHSIHTALREHEIVEHVWVRDVHWNGTRFVGRIDEAPVDLRDTRVGDVVEIAPTEVEDWAYLEGHAMRGAFTVRVYAERGLVPTELAVLVTGPPLDW